MARHAISLKKLDRPGKGYRVLASWRLPKDAVREGKVDLWIPELAPRLTLVSELKKGAVSRSAFGKMYALQLRDPVSQDLLKPLALLSLRRNVVLLCDCRDSLLCSNRVLAEALEE